MVEALAENRTRFVRDRSAALYLRRTRQEDARGRCRAWRTRRLDREIVRIRQHGDPVGRTGGEGVACRRRGNCFQCPARERLAKRKFLKPAARIRGSRYSR